MSGLAHRISAAPKGIQVASKTAMPRHLPVTLIAAWLAIGPFVPPAAAVSVDELVNLKANGLTDDVLVALIETDGSVFQLTSADVLALHRRGLSEKVILAMLATARRAAAVQQSSEPSTGVVQPVPAPPPLPAPIQQTVVQNVAVLPPDPVYIQVPVAFPVFVPVHVRPEKPVKPVYWGFGGERRPNSWTPARDHGERK